MGIKIAIIEDMSDRTVIISSNQKITTRQGKGFKHNRQDNWKSVESIQHEQNNPFFSKDEGMEIWEENK